jgi:hypothetical protein
MLLPYSWGKRRYSRPTPYLPLYKWPGKPTKKYISTFQLMHFAAALMQIKNRAEEARRYSNGVLNN